MITLYYIKDIISENQVNAIPSYVFHENDIKELRAGLPAFQEKINDSIRLNELLQADIISFNADVSKFNAYIEKAVEIGDESAVGEINREKERLASVKDSLISRQGEIDKLKEEIDAKCLNNGFFQNERRLIERPETIFKFEIEESVYNNAIDNFQEIVLNFETNKLEFIIGARKIGNVQNEKAQEVLRKYSEAQRALCKNGVSFFWSLRGQEFELLKGKLVDAREVGQTYLQITDINGKKYYADNMPHAVFKEFYSQVNAISTKNHRIKESNIEKIGKIQSKADIDALTLEEFIGSAENPNVIDMNKVVNDIKLLTEGKFESATHYKIFQEWFEKVKKPNGDFEIFKEI